jgi:hypothetical protein
MSNAERQRRRKDRWRRGRACAIVEYDYFVLTEMLIRSGDLEERSIDDRGAVGRAIGEFSRVESNYRRARTLVHDGFATGLRSGAFMPLIRTGMRMTP